MIDSDFHHNEFFHAIIAESPFILSSKHHLTSCHRSDIFHPVIATFFCHCEELSDEAIYKTTHMVKRYYIYIMSNGKNSVLYTGVTNDLIKRVHEHKEKLVEGFIKKYKINKLVYFEVFDRVENAILREKQIKGGSRKKNFDLITNMNPEWKDLYESL